jgi:type I restriction enzyme R subunit
LYVDKPMRGQGLMQAVARVNRVWKDKPGGLVVDYIGIGEELKQAIAQYTRARGGDQRGEPVEFIDEALKILKDTVGAIRDMLHGVNLEGIANDAKKALAALPLAMNHLVKLNQKPEGAAPDGTSHRASSASSIRSPSYPRPRHWPARIRKPWRCATRLPSIKR